SCNLLISAKCCASNMEKLPIQMAFEGEILFGANPIDTAFELRQPSSRFSFRQSLLFAFSLFQPCLGNEQRPITERAHKIRQVLMRLALIEIRNGIRRTQWRM